MEVSLIILGALVVVGLLLYVLDRHIKHPEPIATEADSAAADEAAECCGMHITCEKDSLLASVSPEIVYYDDEELDRHRGRSGEDYSDGEIDEFRDILLTLLPQDIAGWARSLQLRDIVLPQEVRDELLLIVSEARQRQTQNS